MATAGLEGLFSLGEGNKSPFFSIPSPSELRNSESILGCTSVTTTGVWDTTQASQGSFPHSHRVLGATLDGFSLPVTVVASHPSGFFDSISRQDLGPEDNRASDLDENPQAEGTQQPLNRQTRTSGEKRSKLSKIRERGRLLVFGVGISMDQATLTKSRVLVRKVRGWNYTPVTLKKWTT